MKIHEKQVEVEMMDAYLIKIDDRYFVNTNDEDFGKVPVGRL